MNKKNVVYFPYLPNSQLEDNKRCKQIMNDLKNDPFIFHRKKVDLNNNKNIEGENNNQELLFLQKKHDKSIISYNSFMKNKSAAIDMNARNYLDYINNKKNYENNIINSRNINNYTIKI